MKSRRILCVAIGLATAPAALPALAQDAAPAAPGASPSHGGLTELTDAEMGDMRGRYTVGDSSVAWFGVTMISTWQTQTGQVLKSSLTVAVNATQGTPKVTFVPHVSITEAVPAAATTAVASATAAATTGTASTAETAASPAAAPPSAEPAGQREIDNAGLANVTGMVQSVQVAGDGNAATNTAQVSIRDHGTTPEAAAASAAQPAVTNLASASAAGVSAVAQLQGNAARVLLQIDGQGAVEQWISRSGMGQTIQLASDGQQVSNRMEIDLVRSASHSRAPLGQNVAQAIALSRGIAIGY